MCTTMVESAILLTVDHLEATSSHLSKAKVAYIVLLPWTQLYTPVERHATRGTELL